MELLERRLFLDPLGDYATDAASGHGRMVLVAGEAVHGVHDVQYLRYWVDETRGRMFCLVDAPDAEAAAAVHRDAHGLVADEIYRVQEGV